MLPSELVKLGPFELTLNYEVLRVAQEERGAELRRIISEATRLSKDKNDPTSYLVLQILLAME